MTSRALTNGERALAASIFGPAIDYDRVCVHIRKFWPFQPRTYTMAPDGHLWFHPHGDLYCADFGCESLSMQGHFIHEMTHVWQAQTRGRWYLLLMRHPWCRYDYALEPGKPFDRYGIEQQAEIVRHLFLYRRSICPKGAPPQAELEALVPFQRR
ncbi:vgr related protein [Sphingobium sp. DEHP117]|uniref:vgr related protein n=1 Tax=Sphingobium sp. DEHP117 TaxID=2993436 RepID=UPI0027D72EC7|nr:vgr related protein [Sphingobium sp. DEHP117]MDQ4418877.1 vgr related protein [Sphingobium sp. DEHP117]